ncbi:MAG: helix-turn-helix domain-containing protein [Pyrinomonadaceae bacterium]
MRRREGDGCPIAGALQLIGDKWTMLVVRDLVNGPMRTTDLLAALHPISSRTLLGRLRDMEHDGLVVRTNFNENPPRVEYALTGKAEALFPLLESLRQLGLALDCNECEDRRERLGFYCEFCPRTAVPQTFVNEPTPAPAPPRRELDDQIVLL